MVHGGQGSCHDILPRCGCTNGDDIFLAHVMAQCLNEPFGSTASMGTGEDKDAVKRQVDGRCVVRNNDVAGLVLLVPLGLKHGLSEQRAWDDAAAKALHHGEVTIVAQTEVEHKLFYLAVFHARHYLVKSVSVALVSGISLCVALNKASAHEVAYLDSLHAHNDMCGECHVLHLLRLGKGECHRIGPDEGALYGFDGQCAQFEFSLFPLGEL